ncbi:hypothetical protein BJY16_001511 [Actinoplanes octamycinicus]|uniref:Uncharacterized protein n=1 Tax=Actinoplanes octamycinicus TaxID=135948 RepID=A0A7W7GTQ7_9ACTN|nr:hypothetical protein [Actinoplanes octamycinicus]MBB4738052.1 hypothetical protein [Actinoplanes octamycinicus]GIE59395.1 hypothetical protein Aoc01nite_47970 [Actinoplanes octamycinicus]
MSETVVEFGPAEPPSGSRAGGFLRGLGTDARLAPLVAALGAVAGFASLISEWQVTTVEGLEFNSDEVGETKMLPADLIDLGGIGAAYLGGLFLLVIAVVLTLFGPEAGRRYARVAGLGAGGVLLALLLAMVQLINDATRVIARFYTIDLSAENLKLAYGRGLWCALAGVAAGLLALWLSGRDSGPAAPSRWRRSTPADDEPDEPLELSIMPTAPFASHPSDRDMPHQQ